MELVASSKKNNRVRNKTGFKMHNLQNVEKSSFGQSVCVSVCLAVPFLANSHGRKGKPLEFKLQGIFVYMGHCAVSIFVAISQPVYKIIY